MTVQDRKEFPPTLCELVVGDAPGQIAIHVLRATAAGVWEAWVPFPDTMTDEAYIRWSMLRGETDVERLLVEWGAEGVGDAYQALMSADWRAR